MTTIQDLQAQLRVHIRARMGRGELTGKGLAEAAELPPGHLSNFLNSRRGLSLESMDRLLQALRIGVLDLVSREEVRRRAAPRAAVAVEPVALVSPEHAVLARFRDDQILETRDFNKSFLRRLRPRADVDRSDWLRFVLIKLDGRDSHGFFPQPVAATLLVDRYYNSLEPYRRLHPNLYAVRMGEGCVAAHISVIDNCLMLRPREPRAPIDVVRIEAGRSYSDYIVGRVCHVGLEV
jgi:transcriptional regulator with XRE-family HTH domain